MKDVDERPMPFGVPSKGVGPGPLKPTGRSSVLMGFLISSKKVLSLLPKACLPTLLLDLSNSEN